MARRQKQTAKSSVLTSGERTQLWLPCSGAMVGRSEMMGVNMLCRLWVAVHTWWMVIINIEHCLARFYSLTLVLGITNTEKRAQMCIKDISHSPLVWKCPPKTGTQHHRLSNIRIIIMTPYSWMLYIFKGFLHKWSIQDSPIPNTGESQSKSTNGGPHTPRLHIQMF